MTFRLTTILAVASVLGLTACGGSDEENLGSSCDAIDTTPGPMMRPGENCLSCHQDGFGDEEAPEFSAAGTVFASVDSEHCDGVQGVKVFLTAIDGSEVELVTNEVGNFWTTEPLMEEGPGPRLEFEGRSVSMGRDLPTIPACNACHSDDPVGGASGKIYIP